MKLLDRYLLRTLLTPLAYCLAGFGILIIVHDLFDHLSHFIEHKTSLLDILYYYALLLPSMMVFIVPISLMLSVLYSLSQLTRSNELTAMRASGIGLYRLTLPFLAVGFFFTLLVGVVHETIGPRCGYWAAQFLRYQEHRESAHLAPEVAYYQPLEGRTWWIAALNTKTFEMTDVRITQEAEQGQVKIHAERAEFLDGHWWFFNVAIQNFNEEGDPVRQYDESGNPLGIVRREKIMEMSAFSERPEEFINVTKDPQFLTSRERIQYLEDNATISGDAEARIRVDLHSRLAMPWVCLIVTMLGIPFGATTARQGALMGVILALGMFFGFYFLMHFGLWMGKQLFIPAWLAAWFPNLLFFSIGCVLLHRMR
jgi:lipopolysaccharide export system permease protein